MPVASIQRAEIITVLEDAQHLLERAARLIHREGNQERWSVAIDLAQQTANLSSLLDQDWQLEARAPETHADRIAEASAA